VKQQEQRIEKLERPSLSTDRRIGLGERVRLMTPNLAAS
jgi:hypothetical protein